MSRASNAAIDFGIVRLSSLGDIVQALALLGPLRRTGASALWVVEARFGRVFDFLAEKSRVPCITWDRRLRSLPGLSARVRAQHGAVLSSVDIQGNLKSALVARALRAQRRFAPHARDLREAGARCFAARRAAPSSGPHVLDRGLAVVNAATGTAYTRADLAQPPFLEQRASSRAGAVFEGIEADSVVVVLQHLRDARALGLTLIDALVARLSRDGRRVVMVAGPRERDLAWPPHWTVLRQEGGLEDLIALGTHVRDRCAFVVGPDCGATHVLRATGAATCFVFGPQDEERTGPIDGAGLHTVVKRRAEPALACQPCLATTCRLAEGPRCMSEVQAEDIVAALHRLRLRC